MYECVKDIYHCPKHELSADYFFIIKHFKEITDRYKYNFKTKLYIEKGDWSGVMPTVDDENNDELIFYHYYASKTVPH